MGAETVTSQIPSLEEFASVGTTSNVAKYTTDNPLVKFAVTSFLDRISLYVDRGTSSGDRILNAGCGEGIVKYVLEDRFPDRSFYGLDIDDKRLATGQAVGLSGLLRGDVHTLPFDRNSFDQILLLEVLEHLENPRSALKEAARVSRSELILSVPNDPLFRLGNIARGKRLAALGNGPGHVQHFHRFSFPQFVSSEAELLDVSMPGLVWVMTRAEVK